MPNYVYYKVKDQKELDKYHKDMYGRYTCSPYDVHLEVRKEYRYMVSGTPCQSKDDKTKQRTRDFADFCFKRVYNITDDFSFFREAERMLKKGVNFDFFMDIDYVRAMQAFTKRPDILNKYGFDFQRAWKKTDEIEIFNLTKAAIPYVTDFGIINSEGYVFLFCLSLAEVQAIMCTRKVELSRQAVEAAIKMAEQGKYSENTIAVFDLLFRRGMVSLSFKDVKKLESVSKRIRRKFPNDLARFAGLFVPVDEEEKKEEEKKEPKQRTTLDEAKKEIDRLFQEVIDDTL